MGAMIIKKNALYRVVKFSRLIFCVAIMNNLNKKVFYHARFFFPIICLLVAGAACTNLTCPKTPLVIVDNNKSILAIVIGKDAGKSEEFAASELQKYVKQISGAELEIKKISSGKSVKNAILIGTEPFDRKIY
jgi:hypothetical protein